MKSQEDAKSSVLCKATKVVECILEKLCLFWYK